MAQGVEAQGVEGGEGSQPDRKRSRLWPWILLLAVVLLVVLLLWLYWQKPQGAGVVVVRKSTTIVAAPQPRPEPIVPTATIEASETTSPPYVPDVLGDPKATAERALESAGYSVSTSYRITASKASGLVVQQSPAGGTQLDIGSVVRIVVSSGTPAVVNVTMPKIVGLTQQQAEDRVRAAGLVPSLTYAATARPNPGHCVDQWPEPGTVLPKGSDAFIQVTLSN